MDFQISDHATFCDDIISGVISGLKFEERHNDVVRALRTIAGRLEMLEGNSVSTDSRPHGLQRQRSSRNAQIGRLGNNDLQNSISLPIKVTTGYEDNDPDSGFASDSHVTSKADRTKGRWNSFDAEVLRKLQDMHEQLNLQSLQVCQCLHRVREEMAHVAGINNGTSMPSAYHYDLSRTLDKISHAQSDNEAIMRCLNEKVNVTLKDFASNYIGISKMLHNISQAQAAQEAVISGVGENMSAMHVAMASHTNREFELETFHCLKRLEDEVAGISQKTKETLEFSAHYPTMSKTVHKILHAQVEQEQFADSVNEKLSVLTERFASATLEKLVGTQSKKEKISGCLIDLKDIQHGVANMMRQASRSPPPSPYRDKETLDDLRDSYGSISPRHVNFDSPSVIKQHGSSRRQASPGRFARVHNLAKQNSSPAILEKEVSRCDRDPIHFACACGYTCGTLAALERHLAKFTDRSRHYAVKSY